MFSKHTPALNPAHELVVTTTIECGLTVHRVLGPGFREYIYEQAFRLELAERHLSFEAEKLITVRYKRWSIPGQRIDLIVGGVVLVEIKAVSRLKPIHVSQVVSYLRTTGLRVGLLMNFNGARLKDGLRRVVL